MLQVSLDENERVKVSMLLEFVANHIDTTPAYTVQLYRIVDTEGPLIDEFMKPCFVDVKKESNPMCFWRGDASETRGPKPARKRQQGGALVGLGPRPSSKRKLNERKPGPGPGQQLGSGNQGDEPFDGPDADDDQSDDDGLSLAMDRLLEGEEAESETENEFEVDPAFEFQDLFAEAQAAAEACAAAGDDDEDGDAGAAASNDIPEGHDVLLEFQPSHPAQELDDDDVPAAADAPAAAAAAAVPAAAAMALRPADENPPEFGSLFAVQSLWYRTSLPVLFFLHCRRTSTM